MHVLENPGFPKSSSARLRSRAVLALLLALAACHPAPRSPAPATPVAPAPAESPPAGPAYRIDAGRSEIRILVYRAGALARLGHNHVIVSRALAGEVRLAKAADTGETGGAGFDVSFPVATLIVDEPALRAEEGSEFATQPTPADVEGTRKNMLGPGVLDAANSPTVRVYGLTSAASGSPSAHARLVVRGHVTPVEVPLTVVAQDGRLTVSGGFGIAQTALGLTPFSVALGALTVRDGLEIRFRIVAVPAVPAG
jgi:hypothetical protein